jgi:hypothetical protein
MSETRCHSILNIQKRKQNYEEKMVCCICLCSNNADTESSNLHSQLHSNKDKNTPQISQCTRNKHNRYAEAQQDFLTFSRLMTYIYIYIYIYICRTAPLTSRRCILYIYSTNKRTEYFKHAAHSPFFPLQNAIYFIMLTFLVPVLFTF